MSSCSLFLSPQWAAPCQVGNAIHAVVLKGPVLVVVAIDGLLPPRARYDTLAGGGPADSRVTLAHYCYSINVCVAVSSGAL